MHSPHAIKARSANVAMAKQAKTPKRNIYRIPYCSPHLRRIPTTGGARGLCALPASGLGRTATRPATVTVTVTTR